MELVKRSTGSKTMVTFSSSAIQTNGHWAVGTQWQYAKGLVTMYDEGFHCDCKKNPRTPCSHIKNVKLRIYGTFDDHYQAE